MKPQIFVLVVALITLASAACITVNSTPAATPTPRSVIVGGQPGGVTVPTTQAGQSTSVTQTAPASQTGATAPAVVVPATLAPATAAATMQAAAPAGQPAFPGLTGSGAPSACPALVPLPVQVQSATGAVGLAMTGGDGSHHRDGECVVLCYFAKAGVEIKLTASIPAGIPATVLRQGLDDGLGECFLLRLPVLKATGGAIPFGIEIEAVSATAPESGLLGIDIAP